MESLWAFGFQWRYRCGTTRRLLCLPIGVSRSLAVRQVDTGSNIYCTFDLLCRTRRRLDTVAVCAASLFHPVLVLLSVPIPHGTAADTHRGTDANGSEVTLETLLEPRRHVRAVSEIPHRARNEPVDV